MMSPRNRTILIVSGAVLLLGLLIALAVWLLRPEPSGETVVEPPPSIDGGLGASAELPSLQPNPLAPAAAEEPESRTAAVQVAELFAERYGSYSNQGDYRNLQDLLPVMTDRFRRETEAFIAEGAPAASQYEGVTSLKVSTRTVFHSDTRGEAEMSVTLQQEKTVGTAAPTVGYRTLRVILARVGEEWKVDSVRWEN